MRKLLNVGIVVLVIQVVSFAQVMNTATVLKPGSFSLSVAPIIYVENGNDLGLFLSGGFGVANGVDLGVRLCLHNNNPYFGGDVEFSLLRGMPAISLTVGAHAHNDAGIDANLNITFPIRNVVSIYSGVDCDVEFKNKDQYFPLWIPVGIEVKFRRSLGVIMEVDIAVTDEATSMFLVGLNIFF